MLVNLKSLLRIMFFTKVLIKDYNYEVPTYEKWIELNKNKKKPFKKSTVIHK